MYWQEREQHVSISLQGIVDGGCALILASEAAVQKHGLEPLAKIVSYGISGKGA